jgi:drug/metabolite transporter (DMT)-like permease
VKKVYGIFYAMLSSAAFGFMPIFAKVAHNSGITTLTILSLRFLIAAIILLSYFLFTKRNFKVNRKQFTILALVGALGYTSTGLTLFFSYNYIPVGLATTMHFIYPAIVMIFNYFIYKESFTKYKLLALILSLIGVYILIGIKSGGINLTGALLAITSGFTYTGCVMGMNHPEAKKVENTVSVFYFSVFAGLSLLGFALINNSFYFTFTLNSVVSVLGLSLVSTIISIALFIKALKIIGATSTSILGTFEPIVSIIMGIILFGEKLTPIILIGTLLILVSVILLARETKRME